MKQFPRSLAGVFVAGSLVGTGVIAGAAAPANAADCATPLTVEVSALLSYLPSGNYGAFNMDDAEPGSFPLTEPYSSDGKTVMRGGEQNTISSINDVADWVVVELRDATDPSLIVATDTVTLSVSTRLSQRPAQFFVPPGAYRVAITHRNHLTTMAANPIQLAPGSTPFVDFVSPNTTMYNQNPANAGKERVGYSGQDLQLVPGDVNRDNQVNTTDFDAVRASTVRGELGYKGSDANLDGFVDVVDLSYAMQNSLGVITEGSVPIGRLSAAPSCDPPVLTTPAPPLPAPGTAYSFTVAATGTGTITYTVTGGSLPAGLVLDPATGVISGSTTATGTFRFTVTATNAYGSDADEYSFVLAAPPSPSPSPSGSTSPSPTATVAPAPSAATGVTVSKTGRTNLAVTGAPDASGAIVLGTLGITMALIGGATLLLRRRVR